MPKKYRLYDTYEGCQSIGEFNTMREVCRAAVQRDKDTDGECYLILCQFCNASGAYKLLQGWTY
jgi:hypothetical protein